MEKALEGEIGHHLGESERSKGNRRNGSGQKNLKTSSGPIALQTPRDRQGSFTPQIVGKREVYLGDDLEEKIIKLYARGMSARRPAIRTFRHTYPRFMIARRTV